MPSFLTEAERLQATRELGLFDTPPEQQFDDLVQLASCICGVPVALMTLLDADRQFHKSHIGIDVVEIPRTQAFCDHTIRQNEIMVIEDAMLDERFAHNPLVLGHPNIRFYAGAPLSTPDGAHVGALCVIDSQPHTLTATQRSAMQTIAHQIELRMELRRREVALEKTARDLALSRDSFRSFADAIPIEAYLKDSAGRILFYNRRVAQRFNIDSEQWLGKTSYDLWPSHVADQISLQEAHVLRTRRASESYLETPETDGTVTYWKTIKVAVEQASGEVMVGSVSIDLTEDLQRESRLQEMQDALESANRKLQTLSMTDELTGLWNRRAFDQRIAEEISSSRRTGHPLTLALLDLDQFKAINDNYGHLCGDDVLRQTADLIRNSKRIEDVALRFGGEEFALLLPHSDAAAASVVCERLLQIFRDAPWEKRAMTVSIGIAILQPNETAEQFTHRADLALYAAKHAGKDRAAFYDPSMQ